MDLPNIKNIVPVASGKGGVGKSTVSANIAIALAKSGAKVGLMDADVYGPSIPTIFGITEKPTMVENRIIPLEKYGVKVISMGFFLPMHEAAIWRGPMLNKMVQDFLSAVEWGDLDYLIVDLPPGTGDVQLSLCQSIAVTGAVIVSTPQDVAWNVAQKAIVMFDKLNTPVVGIVENMSHYICGHCGKSEEIFGAGGAKSAAQRLEIPFLGSIPLVKLIRTTSDDGLPVVQGEPESEPAKVFLSVAQNLVSQLDLVRSQGNRKLAPIEISPAGSADISFLWNDGKTSFFKAHELRYLCPCAVCVDEITGERKLRPGTVVQDVKPLAFNRVGRYAIHIEWSDGHNTGLYGFEYLRKYGCRTQETKKHNCGCGSQ